MINDGLPDSDAPPRGARTMGLIRWALVAIMALVALGSIAQYLRSADDHQGHGAQVYYCPMHPQIVQDRPGECPICGMTLVLRPAGAVAPSATMTPTAPRPDAGPGVAKYHCPMHPEVTSDDPNATCPKCGGMKLVPNPRYAGAPSTDAVAGLVPVELPEDRVQLIGLRTAPVVRQNSSGLLQAPAVVTANERRLAQINVRFSGFVEQLLVAETGQRVRRGQPLATIYAPELLRVQQELLTARSWRGQAANGDSSGEHHGLTRALDEDARRRLELLGISAAEIDSVIRTGRPLTALAVRSPVDGFVISKNIVQGGTVAPGAPLFEVADLSTVWAVAEVHEGDVGRVRVGQRATLTLGAYPGETFAGKVQFLAPVVDPATRTMRVRVELRNPADGSGPKLRPGMYGELALDLQATSALFVPAEAVVDTGDVQYVFVATTPGRFEPRRIQRGAAGADGLVAVTGVREGETVVTTANFLIDSESRLRAAIEGRASGAAPQQPAPGQ